LRLGAGFDRDPADPGRGRVRVRRGMAGGAGRRAADGRRPGLSV